MEGMTLVLLSELRSREPGLKLTFRHVDMQVNHSQLGRERFQAHKLLGLLRQVHRSTRLAFTGFDAYYPISQNRIGLVRDAILLVPFRLARRSVTLHLHGSALDAVLSREPAWLTWLLRLVISRRRARGIVLSGSFVHCLIPLVRPGRIGVVANTVVETPLDSGARQRTTAPLRVLYLGTLMRSKGYRELIEAVRILADQGVPIGLELAGEPLAHSDTEWIANLEACEAVKLRGPLGPKAKWDALRDAHVLVVPSTAPEGQPLALLEGMAAGCAVIGTDRGGIAEMIGSAGITLPALEGDRLVEALCEVLSSLADDFEAVLRLGEQAQGRYHECFSRAQFTSSWLEVMEIAAPVAGERSGTRQPSNRP
jgi:glycosyltransferase involved in cell wall biosynthesis